jgi:hypothetical protein
LIEIKDGAGATGIDRTSEAPAAPGGEPMTLRVVLAPLFGSDADRAGLEAAWQIACRFDGHLTGLFVRPDPADLVPIIGEGISPKIIDQLIHAAQTELDRRSIVARQQFEAASRSDDGAATIGTDWLEPGGSRAAVVARFGRVADLTVLAGGDADDGERRMVIEAALMDTGRPLLLVPAGWTGEIGRTVAIAWTAAPRRPGRWRTRCRS